MVIDRNIRKTVQERVRDSASVTLGEVVEMLGIQVEEADVARLIEAEKKRAARRVISSIRDKNAVRTHLAMCDQERTFIDVSRCVSYEKLASDADSEGKVFLAEKLYAMADELQALLAM